MGFIKHGVGEVLATEGPQAKTAQREGGWTADDERDLREENRRADGEDD